MSELISEGGFGCVFHPMIGCNGRSTKDEAFVTKIQMKDFNSSNEADVGGLVAELPSYRLYFLPAVESCPINVRSIDAPALRECNVITNAADTSQFIAMNIPYMNGVDFVQALQTGSAKRAVLTIAETYRYLLTAIAKLRAAEVVHMDLKLGNVVFTRETLSPRVIDFGISIPVQLITPENMTEYFYSYEPTYYIWAPEINVIAYMLTRTKVGLTETDVERIATEITAGSKPLEQMSDEIRENYRDALISQFKQFIGVERKKAIDELLKTWRTWDTYSLNAMYLRVIVSVFQSQAHESGFIALMKDVFMKGISADPKERPDPESLGTMFMNIFFMDGDVQSYLDTAKEFKVDEEQITRRLKYDTISVRPSTK